MPTAKKDEFALDPQEAVAFRREGWLGPFPHPLLKGKDGVARCERTAEAFLEIREKLAWPGPDMSLYRRQLESGVPWFCSSPALLPEIYDLAAHPAIADRVASILGPNVMVWASVVMEKESGERHGWHVDDEQVGVDGVTVFVGLRNVSKESALKVISGTHHIPFNPSKALNEPWYPRDLGPKISDDAQVLAAARELVPSAEIKALDLTTGDFFMFHGEAWHGSFNTSGKTRIGATFFFARPTTRVRVAVDFGDNLAFWDKSPPCVLVKGVDNGNGVNRIVPGPKQRVEL